MNGMLRILIIFLLFLTSCKQLELYEQHTNLPNHKWARNLAVKGQFEIKDTAALYNIFLILRHTDAYKYNNIWLNLYFKGITDSPRTQKLELSLGNDENGWEGVGMNDILEVRKRLNAQPVHFNKSGLFVYGITQDMRDDPLENIISVGLRLEKAP